MNIAITTTSDVSAKNIALISLMIDANIPPKCILIIQKKRGAVLKLYRTLTKKPAKINPHLDAFCRTEGLNRGSNSISSLCSNTGIKIIYIDNLNSTLTPSILRRYNIEYLINGGGGIFRNEVIDSVGKGILNLHMGLLPRFRGMNSLEWSLFHKQKIGITLHYIDTGIDTGAIINFSEITRSLGDSIADLRHKSTPLGLKMLIEFLRSPSKFYDNMEVQDPTMGKQYFIMHHEIKMIVEARLRGFKSEM
jgi:hypothetical protein